MTSRAGLAALVCLLAGPGLAQGAAQGAAQDAVPDQDAGAVLLPEVSVTAKRAPATPPLQDRSDAFDRARDQQVLPTLGASSTSIDPADIRALPQGENTPLDRVLLQAPGVSVDSALNNPDFHIRNEYSNVQYRINGIPLPIGINGLGPVLDTGFVERLALLDGVLPAQYGLRTAGVIDITAKARSDSGGVISLYGGSEATVAPRLEYGGSFGNTQYYVVGTFLRSDEGLDKATPGDPIHDRTEQGRYFVYLSSVLNDSNRLTFISGGGLAHFRIPDIAGQQPLGAYGGADLNSAAINERQTELSAFDLLAWQTKGERYDGLLSVYASYFDQHYLPDTAGDLAFDNVASNVLRRSEVYGADYNASYRLDERHTLRGGFNVRAEGTRVSALQTILPLDELGDALATPETLPYVQVNLAAGRSFTLWDNARPASLRLAVVNLFDKTNLLRSGTGVGDFASQYGPRRGFFVTVTQTL